MPLATPPSESLRRRDRGIATLRRLKHDTITALSRHLPDTLNFTYSQPGSSIYAERLLSGNQIRILRVHPSSDPRKRLECELELVNLDDSPAYEALSYVWGVDPPSVSIICNNQRLRIRPELSYALARLRLKHTIRAIWADALCINQNDKKEKSHQVPLMGKVFSQASRVNVWLGHGDENVIKEAFECSKSIANACREFSIEHGMNLKYAQTHRAVELPATVLTPSVRSSLTELYNRPLFSRVWCVQEVGLAQDALVVWGKHELPWADVGLSASWIFNKQNKSFFDGSLQSMLDDIDVGDVDLMYELDRTEASLLETLSDFRSFQSTDPKDKVYGLLSLVGSGADVDPLIPNYEKSVAQVYADTVTYTLGLTGHLEALAYIQHHGEYDGDNQYRSWAPRWDLTKTTSRISSTNLHLSRSGACDGRAARFVVTKDSEDDQLCLTGIIYDTVSAVSAVFHDEDFKTPRGFKKFRPIVEIYEAIDFSNPEHNLALHAIARTLTVGYDSYYGPLGALDDKSLRSHYEMAWHFLKWWHTLGTNPQRLGGDAVRYQKVATASWRARRLFSTYEKDYGVGPECMRAGDVIAVLYGGGALFVLRPKGNNKYLLLGEAYVDSIMHGELVKDVEDGKRQEQEFHLI